MAYRGDDLDLRTPQAWSSAGREAGAAAEPNWWTRTAVYKGGRNDPIWVDDHVMTCCNHAYDLAVAHRAPEVRLEHLINALTLNDHAALVLEARGLSVASLRRESGAAIANDIPAATSGGTPRRSEGVEEALRLAADHAYPRRTPVTVDDLLHVLFDMKRDLPGLQLLRRHSQAWNGRNGAEPRSDLRLDPLPHLSRPRYASSAAADYFGQPPARDVPTSREPAREPPSRDLGREPLREPLREPTRLPTREMLPPATVDTFQDTRLDSLERAVRDLGVDLADDRKTIRSLVADLQRTSANQADDAGRFRGGLSERLAALEDTLVRSRNETAALPNAVMDRIGMIERSIDARLSEVGRQQQGVPPALIERLAALERTIDMRLSEASRMPAVPQLLIDRLAALERTIEVRTSDLGRFSGPSPALLDRLSSIERGIEARLVDMSRMTLALGDRLQAIEQAPQRPVEATLSPLVSQRLETITQFSTKVDSLERTFQMILDRMTGVESKLAAASAKPVTVDLSVVESRLTGLEGNVREAVEQSLELAPVTDLLSGIEARIAGLERTLDNRTAETGRTVSFIGERLRSFEEAIGGQKTTTVERLGQLERSLTAYAESTVAAGNSHLNDLGEVHEALLKLNANQQTLAGSLDQWRLDNTGDLSVISNRLKLLEDVEDRRGPQLETLAQQVGLVHNALAKREVRKNRFMHWLYGTDEWYSASWETRRWRARQTEPAAPVPVVNAPRVTADTVHIQQRQNPPAPPPTVLRR